MLILRSMFLAWRVSIRASRPGVVLNGFKVNQFMIFRDWRPVLTLVFITPVLTELLSGNLVFSKFFSPPILLFLLVVYGLPVLLIREFAISRRLGIEGIFFLGIAYGIFNEGICAKTLLMSKNVPLGDVYGHYPLFGGINIAWAGMILIWHALHSVLYPILIVSVLYPDSRKSVWLGRNEIVFAAIVPAVIAVGLFVIQEIYPAPMIYLPFFILLIAGSVYFSQKIPQNHIHTVHNIERRLWYCLAGCLFFSFIFIPVVLGKLKAPLLWVMLLPSVIVILFYSLFRRLNWFSSEALLLIILGNYTADVVFLFLGGIFQHSWEKVAAGGVFLSVLALFIITLLTRKLNVTEPRQ